MNMKSGTCPKCGGNNLGVPRHFRAQGIGAKRRIWPYTDMNIISCNECRYSELYEMDAEESAPIKRNVAMIWLFAVILPTVLAVLYFSFR